MTEKERRSIELARRHGISESEVNEYTEKTWRAWVPDKPKPLTDGQLVTVRRCARGNAIDVESMFLLHSGHGITGSQAERAGFEVADFGGYCHLLHGLRRMTMTIASWKEDLLHRDRFTHEWRPLLTLQELRDDGYGDIAESLRSVILREWRDGKYQIPGKPDYDDLPPGMNVSGFDWGEVAA